MGGPANLDTSAAPLYHAVGAALTEWERLEVALANLHTTFHKRPRSFDLFRQYGSENQIFANRLAAVERAAQNYFTSFPSQEHEGEFSEIVRQLRLQSKQRNLIAHGQVREAHGEFGLYVPWYAVDRFSKGFERTNSTELQIMIEAFSSLRYRIASLEDRLAEESWPGTQF